MTGPDRVALVTGASSGIGREIAITLGRSCRKVWVNYLASAAGAAETVQAIEANGGSAEAVQASISDRADVERMMARVLAAGGALDVLVNNAGGGALLGDTSLLDISGQAIADVFALNLFGAVHATQIAARHLISRHAPGRVVNIGSVLGRLTTPGTLAYSAAKAALSEFTRTAAITLAPHRITVNCVAPGFIDDTRSGAGWDAQTRRELPIRVPLGPGSPADVAAAVEFLSSDQARYITGQTLTVDGGFEVDGAYPGTRDWAVARD